MSMPAADRLVADRYALKAPLGRGGMGVVWRAHDAVLGREVAVKEVVFPPTMAEQERRPAQARVMREARAAARLNHPAAVTLYDVVQDQGVTFIVMELVNAPTLADLVRGSGPLPVERVAEIGAQVASALEAAHAAGRTKETYLSAQYRRLASRRGKKRAAVAVGHTILVIAYHLLQRSCGYEELGGDYFDKRDRQGVESRLVRRLEGLGYKVSLDPVAA
jgi:serine/threonine protein kinase